MAAYGWERDDGAGIDDSGIAYDPYQVIVSTGKHGEPAVRLVIPALHLPCGLACPMPGQQSGGPRAGLLSRETMVRSVKDLSYSDGWCCLVFVPGSTQPHPRLGDPASQTLVT